MNQIKVNIDKKKNSISIWNNGKGIPVVIHKEHNIYVPELVFGHLLTSSNYDDSIKKVTGGRNGFGAKLTNIFSKKFTVSTSDSKNKKAYQQTFSNNMSQKDAPIIDDSIAGDFTMITFEPDLKKFNMKELDDDIISLMHKRVIDIAGVTNSTVSVYLNGKKIQVKCFKDYVDYYLKDEKIDGVELPRLYDNPHSRWEIVLTMAETSFSQVSFVNSICTSKGGTHVNHIVDQIIDKITEFIKKKHKDVNIKPAQIKQGLWIFVNCQIENPSFDSQTKETMTLKIDNFGSKCTLTDKFCKELLKSPIITNIVNFAKAKEKVKLNKALSSNVKKSSRLIGIDKLEDANDAGTSKFEDCTLIITEGDSAKALAMAGIQVVGRDKYGVFPLKGKFLNVREATDKTIIDNKEIQNLIKILGLQKSRDYSKDIKGLRYGSLMIMADQDHDGSHIKGLVTNFIHHFWPSLIHRNNFLKEFITPIVKASRGTEIYPFYTLTEYNKWFERNKNGNFKIKYYKGLGTSTNAEAKDYFININKHRIKFKYSGERDDEAIELAFSKSKAENRKEWLSNFDPINTYLDQSKGEITYYDFINKELIFFSAADNVRSIPNIMDGFKPSERKILYASFKRNLRNELKVAQLAGYVAEHSSYHHGENSLCSTITALAQDFTGTNNVNLLMPIGQFGNRYSGVKAAASPRYIFTCLNKITRTIFNAEDDNLVTYIVDEGQKIEPMFYMPILPMILVNGSDGIGTGWSTTIPQFNPRDIIENIIRKMNNEELIQLVPWSRGFNGQVIDNGKNGYFINGTLTLHEDDDIIDITEIPLGKWTRDYKNFLEENHVDNKEGDKDSLIQIEEIKEYHTQTAIHFRLRLTEDSYKRVASMNEMERLKMFKLSSQLNLTNMVLFDHNCKIKKYANVNEIIEEFYEVRLDFYKKRKVFMLNKLNYQLELNQNKKEFINLILNQKLSFKNQSKTEITKVLKSSNFLSIPELKKKYKEAFVVLTTDIVLTKDDDEETLQSSNTDFDYLMNMNFWNLTHEKMNELEVTVKKLSEQIKEIDDKSETDLWKDDLEQFLNEFEEIYKSSMMSSATRHIPVVKSKKKNRGKGSETKKLTKKKKADSDSEDAMSIYSDESDDDDNDDYIDDDIEVESKKEKPKAKNSSNNINNINNATSNVSNNINASSVNNANKSMIRREPKPELMKKAEPVPAYSGYDDSLNEVKNKLNAKNVEVIDLSEDKELPSSASKPTKKEQILTTHINSNEKDKEKDKEKKEINPEAKKLEDNSNSLLKLLGEQSGIGSGKPRKRDNFDNIYDHENKGFKPVTEPDVLPLKERLAQRSKAGTIDAFMRVITDYTAKQTSTTPKPSNPLIKNDEMIHNLLNKKRGPEDEINLEDEDMKNNSPVKKAVRSAKKSKLITDSDEEEQEKVNKKKKAEEKNKEDFDEFDLDFDFNFEV